MPSHVVIDIQCFINDNKTYILKELALCELNGLVIFHGVFKPPFDFKWLSKRNQATNRYCTNHIHGLKWSEGDIEYSSLSNILLEVTHPYKILLTKGNEKKQFLENILKRTVTDLGQVIPCPINELKAVNNELGCAYYHNGLCAKLISQRLANYLSLHQSTDSVVCNEDPEG